VATRLSEYQAHLSGIGDRSVCLGRPQLFDFTADGGGGVAAVAAAATA
jgi:hypothetical protein